MYLRSVLLLQQLPDLFRRCYNYGDVVVIIGGCASDGDFDDGISEQCGGSEGGDLTRRLSKKRHSKSIVEYCYVSLLYKACCLYSFHVMTEINAAWLIMA